MPSLVLNSQGILNVTIPKPNVILSAGHRFDHPRAATGVRYIDAGVDVNNVFRTDHADDEGPAEWALDRVPGTHDRTNDDDVDILIHADGSIQVAYREPH